MLRKCLRLLTYYRSARLTLAICVAAGLLQEVISLLIPWAWQLLIDDVFTRAQRELLPAIVSALLASAVIFVVADLVHDTALATTIERANATLGSALYARLLSLDYAFVQARPPGQLMALFTSDSAKVASLFSRIVRDGWVQSAGLLATLLVLLGVDWRLTLLASAALPLYVLFPLIFSRQISGASRHVQELRAQFSAVLEKHLTSMREVHAFNQQAWSLNHVQRALVRTIQPVAMLALYHRAGGSTLLIYWVILALVFWVGGQQVLAGTLTTGTLFTLALYFGRLEWPARRLATLYTELQETLAAADRIFEVLDTRSTILDPPGAVALSHTRGRVVFEHVSFAYAAHPVQLALDDVSFAVEPGESVALVGPSGAGKTTLVSLLLRLYDPTAGRIKLDGTDLRAVTLAQLRRQFGVVFQQPLLIGGSVADNIRFGAHDAHRVTADQVIAAARSANAHDFIMRLPKQYDTRLDEEGMTLSTGETQRIAIARAFLRDSPLLILDEPTSALDETTEQLVLQSLHTLAHHRTTFIITHRPAPLLHVDRIIRLDKGRIIAACR